MFVIKEPKDFSFEKVGIKGKIFQSSDLTSKTRFVLVKTETGHETTIRQQECDFIYYILEGNGYFEIDGQRENCSVGDLVVIPAGRKFTYKGKMKLLLNTTPPWSESQEETIKD
jgi:mannose-6-phosphate isomerase-like protein (cupin superfamily)